MRGDQRAVRPLLEKWLDFLDSTSATNRGSAPRPDETGTFVVDLFKQAKD